MAQSLHPPPSPQGLFDGCLFLSKEMDQKYMWLVFFFLIYPNTKEKAFIITMGKRVDFALAWTKNNFASESSLARTFSSPF